MPARKRLPPLVRYNAPMPDYIYHLAPSGSWADALARRETYYPETYEDDGFTHGTSDTALLLDVANHFYRKSKGDWICLVMTEESLAQTGVEVRFEPPAAVGNVDGKIEGSEAVLFPHLYGGIHPDAVVETLDVLRGPLGQFMSIGPGR